MQVQTNTQQSIKKVFSIHHTSVWTTDFFSINPKATFTLNDNALIGKLKQKREKGSQDYDDYAWFCHGSQVQPDQINELVNRIRLKIQSGEQYNVYEIYKSLKSN